MKKMCVFCAETVNTCAAASEHVLCFSKCVAASGNISMFFNECSKRKKYAAVSQNYVHSRNENRSK